MPTQSVGLSSLELFSGVRSEHTDLKRLHVWGCPCYVLDSQLQSSGIKIPKWKRRARLGQFLGFSSEHSTTVSLIRNVTTGKISPQFHVVFDDLFSTVSTTFNDLEKSLNEVFSGSEWKELLSTGYERYLSEDALPPPLDVEWDPQDHQLEVQKAIQNQPHSLLSICCI